MFIFMVSFVFALVSFGLLLGPIKSLNHRRIILKRWVCVTDVKKKKKKKKNHISNNEYKILHEAWNSSDSFNPR